ncbi:hypothetical protein BY996DRAFT_2013289 [Phakopsora pachyrhizi]|nr:hypothetical protein BY996DRAFT_2013289 [Phakopsora pachyrhizi]
MRIQTFFVVLVLALAYTRSSKSYHYRVLQRRAFNFGLESAKQIEQPLKNVIGVHSSVISAEELRGSNPLRTGSSIVHPEINYVQDSQNFKIPSQLPSESHPSQQAHNQFLPKHVEDIDFTIEDGRSKNLAQFKTGSDSVKKSGKNLADKENVRKIYKTKSAFISYARKIMQKLSNKMKNLKIKFQNYIRRMTLFFKGSKAKAPHPPISRQPSSLESISSLGELI